MLSRYQSLIMDILNVTFMCAYQYYVYSHICGEYIGYVLSYSGKYTSLRRVFHCT